MFVASSAPIQMYYSALLFAQQKSNIRRQFQDDMPKKVLYPPATLDNWITVVNRVKSVDLWKTETGVDLFEVNGRDAQLQPSESFT
ncbi:Ff.00g080430.m01.CDS01 [Fusarium sp. VM40]|nr:Ff.00g080430.m01.CDS01 [Fusarium sp. VM40]